MSAVLGGCRDSTWALDPASAHGILSVHRSNIFRAVEAVALPSRLGTHEQVGSHLSADESSRLEALLALSGRSLADMVHVGGKWIVRAAAGDGGGAPSAVTSSVGGLSMSALETQVRTLHVEAYTLLNPDERKDQANRSKAAPSKKRSAAYPGDTDMELPDGTLNPFAEWPWEQGLRLRTTDSYALSGRLLRNALRWCNRFFTDALMQVTFKTRQDEQEKLYTQFQEAMEERKPDRALLLANQAIAEARVEMTAIVTNAQLHHAQHPPSALFAHIATRRQAQAAELKVFMADLVYHITEAAGKKGDGATKHATEAYIDFSEGWLGKADEAKINPASLKLAEAAKPTTPPPATTATTGQTSGGSGAAGGGATNKSARTNLGASASTGTGGGGSGGTTATGTRGALRLSQICVFQRNIPCSTSVVGSTLGVVGAPPCNKCGHGAHFYGECPQEWGRIGKPLPGFNTSGARIAKEWTKTNEPIQKTVQAWVKFLSDATNFTVSSPSPAGVAGAPSLADFQARVATAPAKP